VSGLLVVSCGSDGGQTRTLSGYQLTPAPSVGALNLPDAAAGGESFAFRAADDNLLIVYFGYTSCPDVCPTTLTEVKKALDGLGARAGDVDVAMVTIDPNRDSDAIITHYVQTFIPSAHALRTEDLDVLQTTATAFGASFSVSTNADGLVEVSHSGAMFVVDSAGTIVLAWPFGIHAEAIATDLDLLLDRGSG
jgi:protein SCO1/2